MHFDHRFTSVALAGLALCALGSGCVSSPANDDTIDANRSQRYEGYSDLPNDPITLEAYDKSTEQWRGLTWARSSSTPAATVGGIKQHYWGVSYRLDAFPGWQCYVHPTCQPSGATGELILRARSNLSRLGPDTFDFFTYDQGALSCTLTLVTAGRSLPEAYDACMDEHKRTLTLRVNLN